MKCSLQCELYGIVCEKDKFVNRESNFFDFAMPIYMKIRYDRDKESLEGRKEMFREMRRNRQELSLEENMEVLRKGTSGVLAVNGEDGYPYAVPLSYVYYDSKIYFHCANEGHKIDSIKKDSKVSFCVIDQDIVMPEEYTTYYRSVVVFGKACVLEDDAEKRDAIEAICAKYLPEEMKEDWEKTVDGAFEKFSIVAIEVEHLTGKEAMQLVKKKQENR